MTQDYLNMENITPMMEQYFNAKRKYPQCLILFQMGDFFEAFYQDAEYMSKLLNIILTKRGKQSGEDIPMCGVPIHSYGNYVKKLILSGKQVALCRQIETPEEAKLEKRNIVKRDVVKILNRSNMSYELEDFSENNSYLMAISFQNKRFFCHYLDICTEEFSIYEDNIENLKSFLVKIEPVEILIEKEEHIQFLPLGFENEIRVNTPQLNNYVNLPITLQNYFDSINIDYKKSFSMILGYLVNMKTKLPGAAPHENKKDNQVFLSSSTIEKLNLVSHSMGVKNTVLGSIDYTKTPMGKRILRQRLLNPIYNIDVINFRLNIVENIIEEFFRKKKSIKWPLIDMKKKLVKIINDCCSIEDLFHFGKNLEIANNVCNEVKIIINYEHRIVVQDIILKYITYNKTLETYECVYGPDDPLFVLWETKQSILYKMNVMVCKYISQTGINTLKLRTNELAGIFLEIPLSQKDKVPTNFIMRQNLTKSLRYTTPELILYEQNLRDIELQIKAEELQVKQTIRTNILQNQKIIEGIIKFIGKIDFYFSLANAAFILNLNRPTLNNGKNFSIEDGRHIVIEKHFREGFVPNDLHLNDNKRIAIITGPNMGGKSTFLKQNTIIVILGLIGSFVPANKASIALVDGIFSRVGAEDDISQGKSTFLVEMEELGEILSKATEKSFIMLDEIGRGTSLDGGIPIAIGTIEYIHDILKCICLFATNFSEICEVKNPCVSFLKSSYLFKDGQLILLHKIEEGVAQGSFGINVAIMAGLPDFIIKRAKFISQHSTIQIKLTI